MYHSPDGWTDEDETFHPYYYVGETPEMRVFHVRCTVFGNSHEVLVNPRNVAYRCTCTPWGTCDHMRYVTKLLTWHATEGVPSVLLQGQPDAVCAVPTGKDL